MAGEPQPCQFERVFFAGNGDRVLCIRCGIDKTHKMEWECRIHFYGPGDTVFRVMRFLGVPHCRGCRQGQRWLNLSWYKVRGHVRS